MSDFEGRVLGLAIYLYNMHNNLHPVRHHFMWGQCTEEYQNAWLTIARADIHESEVLTGFLIRDYLHVHCCWKRSVKATVVGFEGDAYCVEVSQEVVDLRNIEIKLLDLMQFSYERSCR